MSHAGDSSPCSQRATPTPFEGLKLANAYFIPHNAVEFSVTCSSNGGIDIKIGSYIIHVEKHISAHHSLMKILLFARELHGNNFACMDPMLPKRIIGQISAKYQSEESNAGTSETTLVESTEEHVFDLASDNHRGPALLAARDDSIIVLVCDILMLGRSITGAPVANPANRVRVFIIDSGAAVHATGDRAVFFEVNMESTRRVIRVASGHSLEILGHGSVYFGTFTLSDVKYIPGLTRNVISVSQLLKQDYTTEFRPNGCFIRDAQNQVVGHGRPVNGLFELDHAPVAQAPP